MRMRILSQPRLSQFVLRTALQPPKSGVGVLQRIAPAMAVAMICTATARSPSLASPVLVPRRPILNRQSVESLRKTIERGNYRAADSLASAFLNAEAVPIDSLLFAEFLDLASEAAWRNGDRRTHRSIDDAARSLQIREAKLGPEHIEVAKSLIALGRAYDVLGPLGRAETTLTRALAIREAHLGPKDTLVASTLHELARVRYDLGNLAEARRLYERAFDIRQKALGSQHPDIASSLAGLSLVFNSLGDYTRARSMIERSIAITEGTLGAEHPQYAKRQATLSLILRCTGKFDEAIQAGEEAIAIQMRALGPDHPDLGYSFEGLGDCYTWSGRYQQGLEFRRRGA